MDKRTQTSEKKDISPLLWGLAFGIVFGFLLQKGGATKYDVIIGQLLLTDFTVLQNYAFRCFDRNDRYLCR